MKLGKSGLVASVRSFFESFDRTHGMGELDFAILKTAMLLSAVDGDIDERELSVFREIAESCNGFRKDRFGAVWDESLRSARSLNEHSRTLTADQLIGEFVADAEAEFVREVALESTCGRERAFAFLEQMASADGDYSEIERKCIAALYERVRQARDQALAERYSRSSMYNG